MTSELSLAGAPLAVREDGRARRLKLRVASGGAGLLLTVPAGMSRRRALRWALEQGEWAQRALASVPDPVPLVPGAILPFQGVPHQISWRDGGPRRVERGPGVLRVGGPCETVGARVLRWLRGEALLLLEAETQEIARPLGRRAIAVRVGDPRSRWGSCSSAGAIRYSWRLIMAPAFVRRATVAHEVAHLVHMHHGPEFHCLVEQLLGEKPTAARSWLRREGAALMRIGALQ